MTQIDIANILQSLFSSGVLQSLELKNLMKQRFPFLFGLWWAGKTILRSFMALSYRPWQIIII